MAEKDIYEAVYEKQGADTQQKLSSLQKNIEDHITSAPLSKLENSITGKAGDNKAVGSINEFISMAYAKRMSKDIIMKHLTGAKNEKSTIFGKMGQMFGDKLLNSVMKQENSYDNILMSQEALVIQKFKWELDTLKSTIVVPDVTPASGTNASAAAPASSTESNEWYADKSHYTEDEKKEINTVIAGAQKYAGVKYVYGWNDKKGIDCSGLWSAAFNEQYKDAGVTFGRLTAALFDAKAPDVATKDAERGDRMFWEDPKGIKQWGNNEKGTRIYHIEMALGKPFQKDGKWYVKTYGSSSDENMVDANGNPLNNGKDGTGYRIREIKDNHHFAKPPYYAKLVAMNKGNDQEEKKAA